VGLVLVDADRAHRPNQTLRRSSIPGLQPTTLPGMDPTILAAIIASGATAIVAVAGYLFNRSSTGKTIEAGN
jgi:hypothetical protein